jgi:putative Mn2+ efflux pump MntP
MSLFNIFLIAVGLAADAFAVSVANGIAMKRNYKFYYSLIFGFYFGLFQFIMPVIGYYLGTLFMGAIDDWSAWVAFGLLVIIGAKMIWETYHEEQSGVANTLEHMLSVQNMCMLAIATSIDALAVGVSFALMHIAPLGASGVIGVVAFVLSAIGVIIGNKVGNLFQKGAGWAGGIILIGIGVKILLEHLL